MRRHWVVQQFAEFIAPLIDDNLELIIKQRPLIRLQMLAYSQLWECTGIQRLIYQLANIAGGQDYETNLFLKNSEKTYERYRRIRMKAHTSELKLEGFLDSVYSNQIRNAFSHSDFHIQDQSPLNWLILENFDPKHHAPIPSLEIDVWRELWSKTREFIVALFENRFRCERSLAEALPYRVDISDEWCTGPFNISRNRNNHWQFVPA